MMRQIHTVLFAALLLVSSTLPVRADSQTYTFGVFWDQNEKQTASYNTLSKDIAKAVNQNGGIRLSNIFYSKQAQFHEDITLRKVDFIYANSEEDFLLAIMYGYRPFSSISIFGKEKASHCLYVGKDSDIKDVKGLAGKSILTYPYQNAYSLLRQLIQAPPETTFSSMQPNTDAYKAVSALADGQVDAIFLVETNIDFFEQVNPGPVKKIRMLACAAPLPFMPMMASPAVSDEVLAQMEFFYGQIYTNENLAKYRPFFKQVEFKVFPVTEADYKPFFDLYEYTLTQGWDRDYEKWHDPASVEDEED